MAHRRKSNDGEGKARPSEKNTRAENEICKRGDTAPTSENESSPLRQTQQQITSQSDTSRQRGVQGGREQLLLEAGTTGQREGLATAKEKREPDERKKDGQREGGDCSIYSSNPVVKIDLLKRKGTHCETGGTLKAVIMYPFSVEGRTAGFLKEILACRPEKRGTQDC